MTFMKIEINETKKWQNSLTLKIILLAGMGLILLIPLEMIKSIIREREANSQKVKQEISMQWAGRQNVSGPVLNIPVKIFPVGEKAMPYTTIYHIMPETLNITGNIKTEKRHRSIYEAVVYTSSVQLSGEFKIPEITPEEKNEILWENAYFTLGISDNRGVKGSVAINIESSAADAVPGLKDIEVFKSGISFPVSLSSEKKSIPFSLNLDLSGSENLSFSPVGKTTSVTLASGWNSPGFNGNFLPAYRQVDVSGFKADWLVTNLNRNFPQVWQGNEFSPAADSFGVEFVLQADHYQKSLRSAKYGILFIALTFLALLFAEMAGGENFQVISYLLVSLALVLFFSILNALSEHIGFNSAYFVSSISTIGLIVLFLWKQATSRKPVWLILGLLAFLYSFIYILLTLNDYAYLAGNIGLFVLLAVTMAISIRLKVFRKQPAGEISE